MHKHLLVFILLLPLVFQTKLHSQTRTRFSEDASLFTGQITEFMGNNRPDSEVYTVTGFISIWNSGWFTPEEMHNIIQAANILVSRNARPSPHFINYLGMLAGFREHDSIRQHYPVWEIAFMKILEDESVSLQVINDFIVFTSGLVSYGILCTSNSATWKSDNPDFRFAMNDSLTVSLTGLDLLGFNHIDTLRIAGTSGYLFPLSRQWKGRGGRVTWERAGFEPRQAYAELGDYTIDLTRSEYHADSVLFHFSQYFQSPVQGRLTDRLMSTRNQGDANYPEFVSYRQEFNIRDIYQGIDYEGGLAMQGAKLIGSGGEEGNARLIFYRDNQRWLTAESKYFVFRPQGASSVSTSILFYLENDSVFHPDLHLNYIDNTRELSFNQNQKVISQSPWSNTFHKVDMSFARLIWNIDEPEMRLTMPRAGSMGNASFESQSFFDRSQFERLQGRDPNHPLVLLRKFSDEYDAYNLPASEYARYLRRPISPVRRQLLELTLQGFIFYDTETDLFRIRQRLYDYLAANTGRTDYDVINFSSTTSAPLENALLNLGTLDMTINGIPGVHISNTQNVNIFTRDNTLTLKRNRNFNFDGTINAGNLSLHGDNFGFDYDDFTINLQNVDSVSLLAWIDATDDYGRAMMTNVRNLIRNVTGMLYIDLPENKSGRFRNPEYPVFMSNEKSYVFYESPNIQNGAYKSDNFYYELEPFLMDSLNIFRNEELRFKGKLVSAGIFPDIESMLTLQEDYSLGTKYQVPGTGIPAYGGKGNYHREIRLSNRGLRGTGRLEYLTSVITSEDFIFRPDTMDALATVFNVNRQERGTEFPSVKSGNNRVNWVPAEDIMYIGQTDKSFDVFEARAELEGSLSLGPGGLKGRGLLNMMNARFESDNYMFGVESFRSDTTGFSMLNPLSGEVSFLAGNIRSHVDLRSGKGNFERNLTDEMITFPANRYIADPAIFIWEMNRREFEFFSEATDTGTGLKGARYISTERLQDSLEFISPHTVFNYEKNLLTANEVKYLKIADAWIYPEGETIMIGEKAVISPLNNARIVANREYSYHEIYEAGLQIAGRNDYRGTGKYDFLDELNNIQTINFDKISVSGDLETVASGTLVEPDNFMLSPQFIFAGEVGMIASHPYLSFSGGTKIIHNCDRLGTNWLAFENEIDPVDITIPVPVHPETVNRERIYSGIFVATDSVHVYPAFFTQRKNYADQLIVTADGYMKYDPPSGEYRIAPIDKLRNFHLPGNYISLNPDECIISGEGKLEFGVTLGQLKINAYGTARNEISINETSLQGLITLDFFIAEEALALIAKLADSLPGHTVDEKAYYFTGGLEGLLGRGRAEQFMSPSGNQGRPVQLPEELNKTFVLSDVNLKWNKESRSYRSYGKIGVARVNGVQTDKWFTGYLEITKRRSGDFLDFYLELDDNKWYYFGYTRGVMQTFSSDPEYVGIIRDLPVRTRRMNVPARETRYIYMLATDTKLAQFFSGYQRHLSGEDYEGDQEDEEFNYPDDHIYDEEP